MQVLEGLDTIFFSLGKSEFYEIRMKLKNYASDFDKKKIEMVTLFGRFESNLQYNEMNGEVTRPSSTYFSSVGRSGQFCICSKSNCIITCKTKHTHHSLKSCKLNLFSDIVDVRFVLQIIALFDTFYH